MVLQTIEELYFASLWYYGRKLDVNCNYQWRGSPPFTWTFSFDFTAILPWIFSNQLDFHLVMIIMHQLAHMVASQLNSQIILLLKHSLTHYWSLPLRDCVGEKNNGPCPIVKVNVLYKVCVAVIPSRWTL